MKKNITVPGALHTNSSFENQPKGSVKFALNTVDESNEGDYAQRSNEESNEPCYNIKPGYILLGSTNIGDNNKAIFSVAGNESLSEIGIADKDCNYTTVVNGNLGFKIDQQIDAIFRLRRGCERTLYWVDPVPRTMNLDKPQNYKTNGIFDSDKFRLFKRYSKIPIFQSITEEESGNLESGAYVVSIQYLDQDFNPTEFIVSSKKINIYNDSTSKPYIDIRGSSNLPSDFYKFGKTNKAIKVNVVNLDENYSFYRLAFIKYASGTGQVTLVEYSAEIPIGINNYTYTGQGVINGNLKDIQQVATVLDSADHIEHGQGKLTLSNVKGKQIDFCKLQKYASRIKSNVIFKEIILNSISDSNPKKPSVGLDGIGYMPGEIESFGIVYVFDDGTNSPVYHIPGKATEYTSQMSDNNKCVDTYYTDNTSCADYWGIDSEGIALKNQQVRHHRFPLRSEVNKPLIKKDELSKTISKNYLKLTITGTIVSELEFIPFTIVYNNAGEQKTYYGNINVTTYLAEEGVRLGIDESLGEISIESISENNLVIGNTSVSGLTYSTEILNQLEKIEDNIYKAEIFGINFSGIDLPDKKDTNGNKIIGYYIVKNERDENNKTILDSGIITPMLEEPYFIAHSHLVPQLADTSVIKDDVFAIIHPEYKFLDKEYKNTAELLYEGEFSIIGEQVVSSYLTQDVMAGSSYDPEVAKRREKDDDGFTLHLITKDTELAFRSKSGLYLAQSEIDELNYLQVLGSKTLTDTDDERKEVFNVSSDNKIGFIKSSIKKPQTPGRLPYVVMRRNLSNPYANFRYLAYYKQSENIVNFAEQVSSSTSIFSGDAYIVPMRYSNSFFYDVRVRERDTKSGLFNYIVAGLGAIAAVALTVFSFGLAAPVSAALITMAAGLAFSQLSTGLTKDKLGRVYGELYKAGLKNCIEDDVVTPIFKENPDDDEVQWVGETVTNLWFETSVNVALRHGMTDGKTNYLNAPDNVAKKPLEAITNNEPQNEIDSYFLEKLTVLDAESSNGRLYQGFANAEAYMINKDYMVVDKSKMYYHLGIEYDCCSDCNEIFKGRTHWSETSFQEELTDNYRIFLPNNYRDVEGDTGEITNTFRYGNTFYIHTKEALWQVAENTQERITGEIVSFLGTGEFMSLPPKKMVDDEESSAGTDHKWGMTKTKYGILFPCIDENTWYLFNGQSLQPIGDKDMENWLQENMPFKIEQQFYKANQIDYPYSNNPSSIFGTGFISVFDRRKKRFIMTKKDYSLSQEYANKLDYNICENNGNLIVFDNYKSTIETYIESGYEYLGIENCEMKFSKQYYKTIREERTVVTKVSNTADIHFVLDTSGSFDKYIGGSGLITNQDLGPSLGEINSAADAWLVEFQAANSDWVGNVYKYYDSSERWLNYPEIIADTYTGQNLYDKDIILISFCNESTPYGDKELKNPINVPTSDYLEDYESFKIIHDLYNSFIGIHYPIVFTNSMWYEDESKSIVQTSLAAIKGTNYNTAEFQQIERNPAFTDAEWEKLGNSLKTNNPYPDDGLINYGWVGKFNRNNIGAIISAEDFANDINELLASTQSTEIIEVDVQIPITVFDYIKGNPVEQEKFIEANNSWTISYSIKRQSWVSWHSYIPNMYLSNSKDFFSWKYNSNNIWKHNKKGHYQTFYGQYYPHILEVVSITDGITNAITEDISFKTVAKKYFPEMNEFNIIINITFNKLLAYNSRQITGELALQYKNETDSYMGNQIKNTPGTIQLDNNEGVWSVNALRDMRTNSQFPMFKSTSASKKLNYYIDKIINEDVIDFNKVWYEQESLRDRYLAIRFIFDTFDNIKLITNVTSSNEEVSDR